MLLLGLSGDLYYTGFRVKHRELVTAANGFWLVPSQCLPHYPLSKALEIEIRHLGTLMISTRRSFT